METLNNFLIYALQSPKKRRNLYVGQTETDTLVIVPIYIGAIKKIQMGKHQADCVDRRFDKRINANCRGKKLYIPYHLIVCWQWLQIDDRRRQL